MKRLAGILLGFVMLCCAACETIIDMDDLSEESTEKLVINGVASPDSLLTLFVGYSFSSVDAPVIMPRDYRQQFREKGCWIPNHRGAGVMESWSWTQEELKSANKGYGCRYAKVKVVVNDDTEYAMKYSDNSQMYHCNYRPAVGDRIKVTAVDDFGKKASAETVVLQPQKVEIVDYWTEYKEPVPESNGNVHTIVPTIWHHEVEVVHLKIRITDPGEEENFYRLQVRHGCYTEIRINGVDCDAWLFNDIFKSEDILFRDNRLARGWGGWSAYFSNVFDDHLINGKEYTVELDSWLPLSEGYPDNKGEIFYIELQSIPKDFYHYLKAVYKYRVTMDTDYGEAICIPTNVENGWGMLGSCSGDKHFIEFEWNRE